MSERVKKQMDELAKLITEYKLTEATLETEGLKISLRKSAPKVVTVASQNVVAAAPMAEDAEVDAAPAAEPVPVQAGTPISSPMTGIYYGSSSPSSPPYVKEGDTVTAGQVVGLIEAMKVFNEIHSTVSGIVRKVTAESGQVVNPGDPLMFIG
ncbi:MAG: acetyl-CoA carboxylase biotin carboxyl carrier protein [Armatimonadetes bacterium]|nr:acetyl-CoA carboxylase biotin carboxyl carrier protein [Armatimonadota bacterium]